MKIRQKKNWPLASRFLRSHKVTGTDTNRWVTHDFLLAIHSNHGPISYRFWDKSDKCKIFPTHVYLTYPRRGSSWNIVKALGPEKQTTMRPLPDRQKLWRYLHSFRHNTDFGRTDRQTDGRTDIRFAITSRRRAIKQEAQLMLTTGSTRLAVSRGQQTWYHSTCYI